MSDMKYVSDLGWWLPANETHLIEWMRNPKGAMKLNGKAAYQGKKQIAYTNLCKQFRTAVDVGAHVGLHSFNLAKKFDRVEAFEPVSLHRQCFIKNVNSGDRTADVVLHEIALGEKDGMVSMRTAATSSGDTTVSGDGDIPMRRLDDVLADCNDCDLMKLDCEGYELYVLRGAEQLIRRCKPVICVEQKPKHGAAFGISDTAAIDYLKTLGYRVVQELSGDYLMVSQ